jgi:formylglycine-generating enzyme
VKNTHLLLFFLLVVNWGCSDPDLDPDLVLSVSVTKVDATSILDLALADGRATIHVNGGNPPYLYQWSNGGDSDSSRTNLLPGFYSVVVIDVIGLKDSIAFEIGVSEPKLTIEWVQIPAGTFTMGSPNNEPERQSIEGPQHQVSISTFKMSKYEITFEQYDAFCDATGRAKPGDEGWGRDDRPVINVSWEDAVAFAAWMGPGYRLPTEAEWEYACRAGTTTPFNTGSCLSTSQANYLGHYLYNTCPAGLYLEKSIPVGSYAPNAWGLFDMHGNVSEWCSDWSRPGGYSAASQTNPTGPDWGWSRVLRGGSWFNHGRNCRSAYRLNLEPSYRNYSIGFRLVVPS